MEPLILTLLAAPALLLLAIGLALPRETAAAITPKLRTSVTTLAAVQLAIATAVLVLLVWQRLVTDGTAPLYRSGSLLGLSVYFDGVSSLMFVMVSFVGWVICRYSIRYLDGDPAQGNHFRWVAFTLGAVSLMVMSGNLLMFFLAWLGTSLGLHRLLLHFPERPDAQRAAWIKFTVSRIGDAALAFAFLLIYVECQTLQLGEMFGRLETLEAASTNLQAAAFLLVAAAAIKSAQFPFHTWLPRTLETPTPVSALMHAGIVNAGGYLIVRTSPLVSLAPWALTSLAIVGAVTAIYAATVMMTQTSVKKTLAYSTIAQMGFMMLQCGLGAFSAAMLHILAHSMYKAYAFLSSGSVIADRSPGQPARAPTVRGAAPLAGWKAGWIAAAWTLASLVVAMAVFGLNPAAKPGGLILGAVLALALARWMQQVVAVGDRGLIKRAAAFATGLSFLYAAFYSIVNILVAPTQPLLDTSPLQWVAVATVVACGFLGMLLVQWLSGRPAYPAWLKGWYVHASNGFYVDSALRRFFGSLSST